MSDAEQNSMISENVFDYRNTVMENEESHLQEQLRLAGLIRDVSLALIQSNNLDEMVQQCAETLVYYFDAAFARIWTFNSQTNTLELRASAGIYTHLNGPHSRVPLGTFKIGLIASERLPHLTNAVVGDPRVGDQEWAIREGMVAFAGYPLLVADRVIGVMALFACHSLSPSVLDAMSSVANTLAIGIDRKQGEQEQLRLLNTTQQARIEAEQAHAEAEAALSVRNTFLSNVTHDLKTPLAAIKANLQLVQRRIRREQPMGDAWVYERMDAMERATTKMTGMIDDLLDLSRIRKLYEKDVFLLLDLLPLIRAAIVEQQVTTRRHKLVLTTDGESLPVSGNTTRLDRAITNLLGNAIKYSPQGGDITLMVTREQHEGQLWAQLSITDQGIGIPTADLPHIFTPFQRASNVTSSIQGTGIGLASVAQVVEQHQGTIEVTSEEGKGSSFVVRFPLITNAQRNEDFIVIDKKELL